MNIFIKILPLIHLGRPVSNRDQGHDFQQAPAKNLTNRDQGHDFQQAPAENLTM